MTTLAPSWLHAYVTDALLSSLMTATLLCASTQDQANALCSHEHVSHVLGFWRERFKTSCGGA